MADNQQTVQFPVFQGERVNCDDNTSLGEFTLAPIPPMKAGEAVLEVVFEVDVNGILKVTATEKTSGRSANITISNSVGKLSSSEIETMINGKLVYSPCPYSLYFSIPLSLKFLSHSFARSPY